jgi:hypothetical protein
VTNKHHVAEKKIAAVYCTHKCTQTANMDILHAQLTAIQRRLAFVQTDPIDWRTQVLVFSWGICLFESYLLYVISIFCLGQRRSRSRSFSRAACGSIRFTQSQLPPLSLPNTLHLRCSKNLRDMGKTRLSSQSYQGCISSSSIPSNLPRACTTPGHGGLLANSWD